MVALVVNRKRLINNYHIVQDTAGVPVIPVLKGNAYGIGLCEAAQLMADLGAEILAVARISEAACLRQILPNTKILLFSPCVHPQHAKDIVELGLIASIESLDGAILLNHTAAEQDKQIEVHLKFDTGMGRYGFLPKQYADLEKLKDLPNIQISGCYSHLANCFGTQSRHVDQHLTLFNQGIMAMKSFEINPGLRHLANSTGALLHPKLRLDAVRCGSALVGRSLIAQQFGLKEAAHVEASINDIRHLPAGHSVGYGSVSRMNRDSRIAIIEVGHTDGILLERQKTTFLFQDILRRFVHEIKSFRSNTAPTCHINGQNAVIIGGGGLSNVIADITDITCEVGDTAVFSVNPTLIDSCIPRVYI